MERQNIQSLIILGTILIVFFTVLFLVVIIDKRKKLHSKQSMINFLENQCLNEINALRSEIQDEIKDLRSQIDNNRTDSDKRNKTYP